MFRVIAAPGFSGELENLRAGANRGDGESLKLLKLIDKGLEKLRFNYKYGDQISKNKIPREYTEKYGVKNLWKLNLGSFWRMIYTIRGDEIEVISIVLEVLDHKEYHRKFGYHTS